MGQLSLNSRWKSGVAKAIYKQAKTKGFHPFGLNFVRHHQYSVITPSSLQNVAREQNAQNLCQLTIEILFCNNYLQTSLNRIRFIEYG